MIVDDFYYTHVSRSAPGLLSIFFTHKIMLKFTLACIIVLNAAV